MVSLPAVVSLNPAGAAPTKAHFTPLFVALAFAVAANWYVVPYALVFGLDKLSDDTGTRTVNVTETHLLTLPLGLIAIARNTTLPEPVMVTGPE